MTPRKRRLRPDGIFRDHVENSLHHAANHLAM
jgi:hypothetical protein